MAMLMMLSKNNAMSKTTWDRHAHDIFLSKNKYRETTEPYRPCHCCDKSYIASLFRRGCKYNLKHVQCILNVAARYSASFVFVTTGYTVYTISKHSSCAKKKIWTWSVTQTIGLVYTSHGINFGRDSSVGCCAKNLHELIRPVNTIRLVVNDCHSDEWKRVLMQQFRFYANDEVWNVAFARLFIRSCTWGSEFYQA